MVPYHNRATAYLISKIFFLHEQNRQIAIYTNLGGCYWGPVLRDTITTAVLRGHLAVDSHMIVTVGVRSSRVSNTFCRNCDFNFGCTTKLLPNICWSLLWRNSNSYSQCWTHWFQPLLLDIWFSLLSAVWFLSYNGQNLSFRGRGFESHFSHKIYFRYPYTNVRNFFHGSIHFQYISIFFFPET